MNTLLIGLLVVGGFVLWKFVMQPIMNEGEPIEPPKDYKTFAEKMEEATKIDTNF